MDIELAKYSLMAFAVVTAISVVMAGIVIIVMFKKDPEKALNCIKELTGQDTAIRLITVFAILGTTTVLLFADKLSEGVLALMSAIVGYVLGGMNKSEKP